GTPADEETQGILAGVYKRYWQQDPANLTWLTHCHAAYKEGWERSQQTNTYLGINAATTALWLGQSEQASVLAGQVVQLLQERQRQLAEMNYEPVQLNYWDQATLAEGYLLQRRLPEARAAYKSAFQNHASETRNHSVTREQARRIVSRLGLDLS